MDSNNAQLKIEVDPSLKRAAKVLAAAESMTLKELISSLIVERLETTTSPRPT